MGDKIKIKSWGGGILWGTGTARLHAYTKVNTHLSPFPSPGLANVLTTKKQNKMILTLNQAGVLLVS